MGEIGKVASTGKSSVFTHVTSLGHASLEYQAQGIKWAFKRARRQKILTNSEATTLVYEIFWAYRTDSLP
jgi:hypothetical protein